MTSEDLQNRFPGMRPIRNMPTLFRFNGFGLGMYGRRDYDRETGTYIKTHCICLLFIPIIPIAAYRVADSGDGGWYFLGKESVSGGAKVGSLAFVMMLMVVVAALGWNVHTTSPEYQGETLIAEAREHAAAGDHEEAISSAQQIYALGYPQKTQAREILHSSLSSLIASTDADDAKTALVAMRNLPGEFNLTTHFPNLEATILAKLDPWANDDPGTTVELVDAGLRIFPESEPLLAASISLIDRWYQAEPDNLDAVLAYADLHSADSDPADMVALLEPHMADIVKTSAGARILGQALSSVGRYDDAHEFLFPYTQNRLKALGRIERELEQYTNRRWNYWITFLDEGKGPQSFYTEYESSSEAQQNNLVGSFIWGRIEGEAEYKRLNARYADVAEIVPVALDLGIVHLYRAQDLSDPEARKEELAKAEKTFLAIRGVAGETAEYKLFFGQVKYWLGENAEGRALFEDLLAQHAGNIYLTINISSTLRELGDWEWAREIAELAYSRAKSDEEKYAAAFQRAYLQKDDVDRITWLERADQTNPTVRLELNATKGSQALSNGDLNRAKTFLNKAAKALEEQPVSASRNNNLALIHFDLFRATGYLAHHETATDLMLSAYQMQPSDAILLSNTMNTLVESANLKLAAKKYDLADLSEVGTGNFFSYLYSNQAEKEAIVEEWNNLEEVKSALTISEKLMLLAPESPGTYSSCMALYATCEDAERTKRLRDKLNQSDINLASLERRLTDFQTGNLDAQLVASTESQINRYQDKLKEVDHRNQPLLYAYLASTVARAELGQYSYAASPDADDILRLALQAWTLDPCAATGDIYESAIAYAIHRDLVDRSKSYAELADLTRRGVSPVELVVWTLNDGDRSDAERIRNHPYFSKLVNHRRDVLNRFPNSPTGEAWAFFNQIEPELSAVIAREYESRSLRRDLSAISSKIAQHSASSVLENYWTLCMEGQRDNADQVLVAGRARGLDLPK